MYIRNNEIQFYSYYKGLEDILTTRIKRDIGDHNPYAPYAKSTNDYRVDNHSGYTIVDTEFFKLTLNNLASNDVVSCIESAKSLADKIIESFKIQKIQLVHELATATLICYKSDSRNIALSFSDAINSSDSRNPNFINRTYDNYDTGKVSLVFNTTDTRIIDNLIFWAIDTHRTTL